jgi:hypothetical protein
LREYGQSLVPEPPAMMLAYLCALASIISAPPEFGPMHLLLKS